MDKDISYGSDYKYIPTTSISSGYGIEVLPDLYCHTVQVAKLSPIFPNEPIQLGNKVQKLPSDGSVPHLAGFRWIHTPGHSPGHVSFFREEDHALIAGDAFVTVKQDSLYKVFTQELEFTGPPRYLTTDWHAAKQSVIKLEALQPAAAITGHGIPVSGDTLSNGLTRLVAEFDQIAVPDYGKYVN